VILAGGIFGGFVVGLVVGFCLYRQAARVVAGLFAWSCGWGAG
jgi:hypothetical protein